MPYLRLDLAALTLAVVPWTTGLCPLKAQGNPSPDRLTACDSGAFTVRSGNQPVGRELFTVECRGAAGVTVTARSTMTLPNFEGTVAITMLLDTRLIPSVVRTNGRANGAPVGDTLVWMGDTALLHRRGTRQAIPIAPDASFVGANFHTGLWLALARYDLERGGQQAIPVFPRLSLLVDPVNPADLLGPDSCARNPPAQACAARAFRLRLGTQVAFAWADLRGRVVAMVYPASGVEAVREEPEFAHAVRSVRGATSNPGFDALTRAGDTTTAGGRAEAVRIPVGQGLLAGTLLLPQQASRAPAVLLISGSGPQDRDGRIRLPGLEGYRPLKDIAEALVERGVAVLRLDDPGVGGSRVDTGEPGTTFTVARDARAAVAALRSRSDIDPGRIGLLGHSEGALAAMMVAGDDPRIAAIALLSAPATRGDSLLRVQLEEQLASTPNLSRAARDSARAAQRRLLAGGGSGAPDPVTAWVRAYITIQPAALAARVQSPVLIVHGALDRQVPATHASMLAGYFSRPGRDVTPVVLDSLNHLLLPAATGTVAEYSSLKLQTLTPRLLDTVGSWFAERLR